MKERYVNVDRKTPLLLPPDLRDWVAADDPVHLILEVVEGADQSAALRRRHGGGSEGYPPGMMAALLIYAYAHGIFSSRQIERATYNLVPMRYLCGDHHPDHDTICKFRVEQGALLKAVFAEVLKLACVMGMLRVGTVCLDGTKILAAAAKRKNCTPRQLAEAEAQLQTQIEELLGAAEEADSAAEKRDRLPKELQNRERLAAKVREAREQLHELTRDRSQERETQREAWRQDPIGDVPKKLPSEPGPEDLVNLSDPQSGLQPTRNGFVQGYNAQLATSGQACGLILATNVTRQTNDRQQMLEMARRIQAAVPEVKEIVADTGYDHSWQIAQVERKLGVTVYCPVERSWTGSDQIKSERQTRSRERSQELRRVRRARMESPRGRELMKLRRTTVEPTIGLIKETLGFRRFMLRGLAKVNQEWELMALAFNCRRLAKYRSLN